MCTFRIISETSSTLNALAFAEAVGVELISVRIAKKKELGREPDFDEEMQAIQNEIKKLRLVQEANPDHKELLRKMSWKDI